MYFFGSFITVTLSVCNRYSFVIFGGIDGYSRKVGILIVKNLTAEIFLLSLFYFRDIF